MESRKTGIAILALLAAVTLAGAALGWQIRLQQGLPGNKVVPPENTEPPASTSTSLPAR